MTLFSSLSSLLFSLLLLSLGPACSLPPRSDRARFCLSSCCFRARFHRAPSPPLRSVVSPSSAPFPLRALPLSSQAPIGAMSDTAIDSVAGVNDISGLLSFGSTISGFQGEHPFPATLLLSSPPTQTHTHREREIHTHTHARTRPLPRPPSSPYLTASVSASQTAAPTLSFCQDCHSLPLPASLPSNVAHHLDVGLDCLWRRALCRRHCRMHPVQEGPEKGEPSSVTGLSRAWFSSAH